jgi:dienelactone hydrolase
MAITISFTDVQCTIRSVPLIRRTPLRRFAAVVLFLLLVAGFFALPYVDALGFIVRAADIQGGAATFAGWRTYAFTREPDTTIPTRSGDIPARVYKPEDGFRRTVLLMPGVHRDGINESRLVALAEDLAATGYNVVTVAAPDLQAFKITPAVTDVIEDAIKWTSEQPRFRTDGKIGVLGISFTGGLSIVAAGREPVRDRVAFVMSFGGHGDLSRAIHYLTSGEVLGDLEKAKQSSAVLGAEHVGVHPPHDYGLAVALLNLADRVVPADQVAALSKGIDGFLLASSLAVTDPPKSVPVFEEMKKYQETLPEPSRTYMQYVNDRAVDKLGPILMPVADALKDHPGMPALSAERATPPSAPIFLLHGVDDSVIPSVETVLLAEHLRGKADVHGLLSGLITHAEVNRTASGTEVWRLASFWREIMKH